MPISELRPKIVIWDIDGTLWDGVIDDDVVGDLRRGVSAIPALSERGVINSVCSYNDPTKARDWLEANRLLDHIVFEQVSWEDKASSIGRMLSFFGVSADSVVVVDDDPRVRDRLTRDFGVVALTPDHIETADLSSWGDSTTGSDRLAHYRVLERRWQALDTHRARSPEGDLVPFLRNSRITVRSVEVEENSTRIADLSQRSNRLNLTDSRLDRTSVELLTRDRRYVSRAFRVTDRFGDYGLCGYLVVEPNVSVKHFFWSCRVVNQGVVEAVAAEIHNVYGVSFTHPAMIDFGTQVDWVSSVTFSGDSLHEVDGPSHFDRDPSPRRPMVYLVGGCDMDLVASLWPENGGAAVTVSGLTGTSGVQQYGQSSLPVLVSAAEHGADSLGIAALPWVGTIPSAADLAEQDLVVISMWVDYSCTTIRHPMDPEGVSAPEYVRLSADSDDADWAHWVGDAMSRAEYLDDFVHGPALTAEDLVGYVASLADRFPGPHLALVGAPEIDRGVSYFWGEDQCSRNRSLNEAVSEEVRKHPNLTFVDMDGLVDGVGQLIAPGDPTGFHYRRDIYARMASELAELLGELDGRRLATHSVGSDARRR